LCSKQRRFWQTRMDEVAFLEELVATPSPTGEEDAVAAYLVEQMADLGFDAYRDEAGNAVGTIGNPAAERQIVLLGHMDTVPGAIPVRREGGGLHGRGAVDAKGPLAAFVWAAARAARKLDTARVMVIGAVEEEGDARGARYLARTMPPPWCAIIGEPSGWDGITLGYKGVLSMEYRLVQPASHSAGPQPTAAERAVQFWNDLTAHARTVNGGESGRFHTLDPALRTLNTFSDGLSDGVTMRIVTRLPPGTKATDLKERLEGWRSEADLVFHADDPPVRSEKNTPLVRALLRAVREADGKPRFKLKTGTSDMNVVGPVWGCPIVAYGPGDASLDHTPEEHIEIDEYLKGIEVLARALETLA
jgi:[amino group carrier protein]-lysine/ornithine hydrolase